MEKAFKFKLLVPPRLSQVSAVKPRDPGLCEDNSSFMPQVQSFNNCFENESNSNNKIVLPTETPRPEITKRVAVIPIDKEEPPLRSSQVYSKLFEEAEKLKAWKLKMDYDISQKDRKLQESRKTIETQRKAIQELQFENESLSMKLEEQLNKNEDITNKSNTTRSLCNILKETFERSTEKMSLFEAEREETHGLFLQNNENIQRMIVAFESLRQQAEADQLEMLKAKEGLKQFEDLKVRFDNEYHMKEKKVSELEETLKETESQLTETVVKLQETQKNISQLEDSENRHLQLLHKCKQENGELQEKLEREEALRQESEENKKTMMKTLEETKELYVKSLLEKDVNIKEINTIKEQLTNQIREIQLVADSLQSSLKWEKSRVEELESELISVSQELSSKNTELGAIREVKLEYERQIQALKLELETKEKELHSFEEKIKADAGHMFQVTSEHVEKQAEINNLKDKLQIAEDENKKMVASLGEAINEQSVLKKDSLLKEVKLNEIEGKLSEALKKEIESSNKVERLQNDINKYKDIYDDLQERFNQLCLQKSIEQEADIDPKDIIETVEKMKTEIVKLEVEKQQLQNLLDVQNAKIEEQHQQNENIQELLKESKKTSQNKLMKKERHVKALEVKLTNLKTKMVSKSKSQDENLKQLAKLKEEYQRRTNESMAEHKRICSELENKATSEAELKMEVQKWKQISMEATKNKEDTELKFQQKIADMVALMERHKHEYEKMVEEKDAELNERRMREAEINANKSSLELEMSYLQVENVQLKQQVDEINTEKESLQQHVQEMTKLKTSQKDIYKKKEECLEQEMLALKKQIKLLEKHNIPKMPETPSKTEKGFEMPGDANSKISTSIFSRKIETTPRESPATHLKLDESRCLQTPSLSLGAKPGTTPRIKFFRVRTPPSTEKAAPWKKNILELDPKSDSSEQSDMGFCTVTNKQEKDPGSVLTGLFRKAQGSVVYKSPGTALKLAAMKRMRDAGWTTITNLDKKKKKFNEKIFA